MKQFYNGYADALNVWCGSGGSGVCSHNKCINVCRPGAMANSKITKWLVKQRSSPVMQFVVKKKTWKSGIGLQIVYTKSCSEQMITVQLNTTISTIIQVMRIVIISNAVWWLLVC